VNIPLETSEAIRQVQDKAKQDRKRFTKVGVSTFEVSD
jgi:hypothetical protein